MRDRAGMFDLTAFCIFDVVGPGALECVQRVSMRQMDVKLGKVVYTPVLTHGGGFRSDLTVMRLGDEHFRVVTGGAHGMADLKAYADELPADGTAQIFDLLLELVRSACGAARPRHPRRHHRRRHLARGLPVRHLSHDRDGLAAGTRLADLLRGRSRLGAVRADRAGREAVGHGRRGGRAARHRARRHRRLRCRRLGATAPSASSSTASTTWSRPAWGKVKDQDFIGEEAHVRQREAEPATVMCTLTVDDHTSASGMKRYMLGGSRSGPRRRAAHRQQGRRSFVTAPAPGHRWASTC